MMERYWYVDADLAPEETCVRIVSVIGIIGTGRQPDSRLVLVSPAWDNNLNNPGFAVLELRDRVSKNFLFDRWAEVNVYYNLKFDPMHPPKHIKYMVAGNSINQDFGFATIGYIFVNESDAISVSGGVYPGSI
ncbi:MAG: hypothetical protein HXY25_04650 [Alphaproteobacteria bacterium]|nr:hypothetical protein [Alphaproteobacteria bacterium]